jgi:predicted metal-dependent enzyme (double-stranded beta helix superfamily)
MFDLDTLLDDCKLAVRETDGQKAVREILIRTLEQPGSVAESLGKQEGGIQVLYQSTDLTVLNVLWAPRMFVPPHDHRVWAVIGIYGGVESNAFFRRRETGIERAGGREISERDVLGLGMDAIHSVKNPERVFTGAIHVYGGDFLNIPRSQWDPDTLIEQPYDLEYIRGEFARANEAWAREVSERSLDETIS